MNRLHLNFLIDFLAFAGFILMSTTGFVLKFILPPGSGRIAGEGTGWRAASKSVSILWGQTRHDWANMHLWLSIGFLMIVSMHFFLHWNWIVAVVKNQRKEGSGLKLAIGAIALLVLLGFAIAPFISPVREIPRSQLALTNKVK